METISIILILLGIGLLLLEIFIPSFGIVGGLGIVSMIIGVILDVDSFKDGVILVLILLVIVTILMFLTYRFIAFKKSPVVLKEVLAEESNEDLLYFVGKEGAALTVLRPAGTGMFEGVRLDVQTKGEFIKSETKIVIIDVKGSRIYVKEKTYEEGVI